MSKYKTALIVDLNSLTLTFLAFANGAAWTNWIVSMNIKVIFLSLENTFRAIAKLLRQK